MDCSSGATATVRWSSAWRSAFLETVRAVLRDPRVNFAVCVSGPLASPSPRMYVGLASGPTSQAYVLLGECLRLVGVPCYEWARMWGSASRLERRFGWQCPMPAVCPGLRT